jgi:hypothetical protein
MTRAEARQLLAAQLSNKALLNNEEAINELLGILTYLPLAIVQAATFINTNDISVSRYISLFQQTGTEAELFSEQFEHPSRYREMESTVAKTWHISFDQILRQIGSLQSIFRLWRASIASTFPSLFCLLEDPQCSK